MITYLYWLAVFAVLILVAVSTVKTRFWKTGVGLGIGILTLSWLIFYFKIEQVLVKKYGGVMTISVPNGLIHLGVTWKDDHLWIENFDPKTNTCYFSEYSKSHVLQGKVVIDHCNPALPSINPEAAEKPIAAEAEPAPVN